MQQNDNDQNSFRDVSPHMLEHLRMEIGDDLIELSELQHAMRQLDNKAYRRQQRINTHTKHCGECLSEQIKTGMLIKLSDYWQLLTQSGHGRQPKLHYQVN